MIKNTFFKTSRQQIKNLRGEAMKQQKSNIIKLFLTIIIIFVLSLEVYPKIIANYSETGFDGPESAPIGMDVVTAAGSYLKSQSDYLLFLNKIELADVNGLDYSELQTLLGSAILNMELSKGAYEELTQKADGTGYDVSVINYLKSFNYSNFKITENLNSVIFSDVESFLKQGDIRNLYHKLVTDTQSIVDQLTIIKASVDMGTEPDLSKLWNLNQIYMVTHLFGQYTAKVFSHITG
jgi:hypothetical protein